MKCGLTVVCVAVIAVISGTELKNALESEAGNG